MTTATVYQEHYFGFVYKWTDLSNGKVYIGSHHGSIDDGYVGSGVLFNRAYQKRPESFIREILEFNDIDDIKQTKLLEQKYLDDLDFDNAYNVSPYASGGSGPHTEEAIEKIKEARAAQVFDEEAKKKMSRSARQRIEREGSERMKEIRSQRKTWNGGWKLSDDTRKKISDGLNEYYSNNPSSNIGKEPWNKGKTGLQEAWNKGQAMSDETKEKLSKVNKGKTWKLVNGKRVWMEKDK